MSLERTEIAQALMLMKQYELQHTTAQNLQIRRNWVIYIVSFMMATVCALLLSTWYVNIPLSVQGVITSVAMIMLVYAFSADVSLNRQLITAVAKGQFMERQFGLESTVSAFDESEYVTDFWDVSRVEVPLTAWVGVLMAIVGYNI